MGGCFTLIIELALKEEVVGFSIVDNKLTYEVHIYEDDQMICGYSNFRFINDKRKIIVEYFNGCVSTISRGAFLLVGRVVEGCCLTCVQQAGHLTEFAKGEKKINLEKTNSNINFEDILFTFFSLGFIMLIIALIVSLMRTNNKRKQQLDRIEKKIDNLNQQSRNE